MHSESLVPCFHQQSCGKGDNEAAYRFFPQCQDGEGTSSERKGKSGEGKKEAFLG